MIRIVGYDLPENKRLIIALTNIYGIGITSSKNICEKLNLDINKKVLLLTNDDVKNLHLCLTNYLIGGDLKRYNFLKIKRLKDIKCYRGIRHRLGLPVRGQRTRTNAKTCRKFKKKLS